MENAWRWGGSCGRFHVPSAGTSRRLSVTNANSAGTLAGRAITTATSTCLATGLVGAVCWRNLQQSLALVIRPHVRWPALQHAISASAVRAAAAHTAALPANRAVSNKPALNTRRPGTN
jgi:hypothetical protein